MPRRMWVLALVWVGLAGCANTPYVEPVEGPVARVRMATHSAGVTVVFRYDDVSCSTGEAEVMRLRAGNLFTPTARRLGIPLAEDFHPNGASEVTVQAGRVVGRFEGGVDAGLTSMDCTAPFVFDAEPGADYEVLFTFTRRGCGARVARISPGADGGHVRVPLPPPAPLDEACAKRKARWT